jgi:hypothetical protein
MQSFIRYFALDCIDLREGMRIDSSGIQLFESKVIQCGEQNNPHNVIRCVTCTRRDSLHKLTLISIHNGRIQNEAYRNEIPFALEITWDSD